MVQASAPAPLPAAAVPVVQAQGSAKPALERKAKGATKLAAPAVPKLAEQSQILPQSAQPSTENYSHVSDNPFLEAASSPLATFSVDVDTASYSNLRRFLTHGSLPPADAVRIEELVNYFTYAYPNPKNELPFSVTTELSHAPWNPDHELLLVGLQGKRIANDEIPPRNLVFLVDVSGSMSDAKKLPLLKYALKELTSTLTSRDQVSLVVYAGSSGVVLEPTSGDHRDEILGALARLEAGGSTNGAGGIEAAYALAERAFDPRGINRVILATDGDFNVGVSSESELVRLIERRRESGIALTVLGFGMGNYKDSNLEKLADHGNGNYAYIDNEKEARKVLVEQGGSTLMTIAKDVKIQVEFNPERVGSYRLIGYENRSLQAQDFNNDRKDAGDIGAGHSVTALFEIVPPNGRRGAPAVDPLKYQTQRLAATAHSEELGTVKLRYKQPTASTSSLLRFAVKDAPQPLASTSDDYRFAASVAGFGMLLRRSQYRGSASYAMVRRLASDALSSDPSGYRKGFIDLVANAERLDSSNSVVMAK